MGYRITLLLVVVVAIAIPSSYGVTLNVTITDGIPARDESAFLRPVTSVKETIGSLSSIKTMAAP